MAVDADTALSFARDRMLDLLRREIRDERVIEAMARVPRERFVPPELRARSYDDTSLSIGEGQTISQPLMVALMLEALLLRPQDRVLEVGSGSGYAAAILAQIVGEVVGVERRRALLERARTTIAACDYSNVRLYEATDRLGRSENAPFDAILVSAGAPHIPRVLLDQLAGGGRLVAPIGARRSQEVVRATKTDHGIELVRLGSCAFVPLIGAGAWPDAGPGGASGRINVR